MISQALKLRIFLAAAASFFALAALIFTAAPIWARTVMTAIFLLCSAWLIGGRIFYNETGGWRIFFGSLTFIAAFISAGSLTYYIYKLNTAALAALCTVLPIACAFLPTKKTPKSILRRPTSASYKLQATSYKLISSLLLLFSTIFLIYYGFSLLHRSSTDLSLRTPWDAVPPIFFAIFFLAALGTFALAFGGSFKSWPIASEIGLALLFFGVAALAYSMGFGFDPFIHRAAESVIAKTGEIHPKPFYYVGQYALVTLIAKLTGGSIKNIDTFLVPAGAALIIPCAYWSLRKTFGWRENIAAPAALAVLLAPASSFIATTPQGLANVFAVFTTWLALPAAAKDAFPVPVLALLAAAAAAIHPLSGIPLLFFVGILFYSSVWLKKRGQHRLGRYLLFAQLVFIGSLAVPAVFLLNARISSADVSLASAIARAPAEVFKDIIDTALAKRRFMPVLDFVYLWKTIHIPVILAAAFAGLALLRREIKGTIVYAAGFAMLIINFLLLKTFVNFAFLIDYERSNYANRMLELALLLISPLAVYAFGRFILRVRESYSAIKVGAAVCVAALLTASLYLAYPRRDKYETSRGWSTSAADLTAVRLMQKDASGAPYAVLANQAVSAAAINEFGFQKYFTSQNTRQPGTIFYYPVPTGGPLYSIFLDMNESRGSREAAEMAMALTGADTIYFVVNNYWFNAQKIIVGARREADEKWVIDDKNFVFKYARNK